MQREGPCMGSANRRLPGGGSSWFTLDVNPDLAGCLTRCFTRLPRRRGLASGVFWHQIYSPINTTRGGDPCAVPNGL
jgi:hypothetical protein